MRIVPRGPYGIRPARPCVPRTSEAVGLSAPGGPYGVRYGYGVLRAVAAVLLLAAVAVVAGYRGSGGGPAGKPGRST
ncbi:hypothetical protein ABT106_13810, partial [Streptomyces sp. NPDC002044]